MIDFSKFVDVKALEKAITEANNKVASLPASNVKNIMLEMMQKASNGDITIDEVTKYQTILTTEMQKDGNRDKN